MGSNTFYDADSPDKALKIYFENDCDLYNQTKNKVIEKVLKSLFSSIKNLKVLEIGAAGGRWTNYFIKNGSNITVVELNDNLLEGNKRNNPAARFIHADATYLNLQEQFDFIFVKDVIEHIPEDVLFLENMNMHLKKGGKILINTQNSFSLNYLVEGVPRRLLGDFDWMGWDPTHVRFYTSKTLSEKLEKSGFKVIKKFGNYHLPYKFFTTVLLGKLYECENFHFIENSILYDKFPFNVTGWGIGFVAEKVK